MKVNNKIRYWDIRPEILSLAENHYRDNILPKLKNLSAFEKVKIITFDGVAPNITEESVFSFLSFINNKLRKNVFSGVGLEMGAGCGFFSSLISRFEGVNKIFAVEISKPIVEQFMPEIFT